MLFVLDLRIPLRLLYSSLSSIPFHHLAWISCCYLFSFIHFSPLLFFVPATSSFKKWTEVLLKLVLGSLLQVLDTYEPRKTTVDAYIQDSTSTRFRLDFDFDSTSFKNLPGFDLISLTWARIVNV